ncbi:MAG TPA: hypothetical protein VMW87_16980, partial [Spirochaetia bacterium]|nr:hypothetical protein [Spirochaetia bacterium]
MRSNEVPNFIEELFNVARLYGWCDQVTEGIIRLEKTDDPKASAVINDYLRQQLESNAADKQAAILCLVVLYRRGTPIQELVVPAHRNLTGRLHANDFPFLIANFFDGVVPLPQSLAHDITEKLFFSIDRIFDKLVGDFQRVPFRDGEPIVFYLMLENCRLDLNAQNRELVCMILAHIEVRLPDPILDDIIAYLDANSS